MQWSGHTLSLEAEPVNFPYLSLVYEAGADLYFERKFNMIGCTGSLESACFAS